MVLLREELTLCKGRNNLPYIIRCAQETLRQLLTRRIFRPVLVDKVTSTTSRRDQYGLPGVISTGPIADQYWSLLPPAAHSEGIARRRRFYFGAIPLTTTTNTPKPRGLSLPLTEEGEMPHRTSSIATYIGRRADLYRFAS